MVEISRRNPGECIEGKDDAIAYLNAAAETGDPTLLQVAIGDVAKARGMGQVAKEAGVGRESLYEHGNHHRQRHVKDKSADRHGSHLVLCYRG